MSRTVLGAPAALAHQSRVSLSPLEPKLHTIGVRKNI